MKMNKKTIISTIVIAVMTSSALFAEPGKCSPCQAAKSARDAVQQSIRDAAAAALAAGKREAELDEAGKCKPCQRTTRDEMAADIEDDAAKCKPCQRTTRDELAADVSADPEKEMVQACCPICAQPGSLGCQGDNKARCATCQQGMMKLSLMEAAAAVLAAADAITNAAQELDVVSEDVTRAPREELVGLCDACEKVVDCISRCELNQRLCALQRCCDMVNCRLERQAHDAKKCCKKIKHKIDDVEDLIGDTDATVMDIPTCAEGLSIVDLLEDTELDLMTWQKSIYRLLYQVYLCACNACVEIE
jgi:hypothetical protein